MAGYVFISYRREPQSIEYVRHLVGHLGRQGIPAWVDEHVEVGDPLQEKIQAKLRSSAAVVVVMTPGADKGWVSTEVSVAKEEGIPIIPLLREGKAIWWLKGEKYDDVRSGAMPSERTIARLKKLVAAKDGDVPVAPETSLAEPVYLPSSSVRPRRRMMPPRWVIVAGLVIVAIATATGLWLYDSSEAAEQPSVPANLRVVEVTRTSVSLAWAASTGSDPITYEVQRSKVRLAIVPDTSYRDPTAIPGVDYTYEITAIDRSGARSATASVAALTKAAVRYGSGTETMLPNSSVDLDASQGKYDLWRDKNNTLHAMNGARIQLLDAHVAVDYYYCSAGATEGSVTMAELRTAPKKPQICIMTSDGRVGMLTATEIPASTTGPLVIDFVVWEQP